MISNRQSFFLSFSVHAVIVVALVITGVLFAPRVLNRRTMELDLLAPVQTGHKEEGPQAPVKEELETPPEEKPTIIERPVEKPTFNPYGTIDPNKIPDVKKQDFKEYKPKRVAVESGGSTRAGSDYGNLIIAICKRNWTPPARGILGRPVPSTLVAITVARNGRIVGTRIERSSGNPALDRSVLDAVRASDPLPAFPRELSGAQQEFQVRFIPED